MKAMKATKEKYHHKGWVDSGCGPTDVQHGKCVAYLTSYYSTWRWL